MMWLWEHLVIHRRDPRPYAAGRTPRKGKYVRRVRLFQEPPTMFMTRKNWLTPEGRSEALYRKKKFKAPTEPLRPTYHSCVFTPPRPYYHR